MADKSQPYSISNDTANGLLAQGALYEQIQEDSNITTALDNISVSGDTVTVLFKEDISAAEKTALDALIAAHDGVPLPDDVETVRLAEEDPDTGGVQFSPRYAPPGWKQQLYEVEFMTSKLNSVHEKDKDNNDIGWGSLKFYKLDNGNEVEMLQGADDDATFQAKLDAECIRTDFLWMPNIDYMILSGQIAQIIPPDQNLYVWVLGVDLDAAFGGSQFTFAEGGINMDFVGDRTAVGLKGVAGTILFYDKVKNGYDAEGKPTYLTLGDAKGTNRMRFLCRHSAGFKHRFQPIFVIFRP